MKIDSATLVSGVEQGVMDILTTLTPTNGSTVTIAYTTGNAWLIDISALTSGAFTIAITSWPSSAYFAAVTIVIKAGTALPAITWPTGVTAPTLTVSKDNMFAMVSRDGGTNCSVISAGAF